MLQAEFALVDTLIGILSLQASLRCAVLSPLDRALSSLHGSVWRACGTLPQQLAASRALALPPSPRVSYWDASVWGVLAVSVLATGVSTGSEAWHVLVRYMERNDATENEVHRDR